MGQKVNPIVFRTGVMQGWKSRWYASKSDYAGLLYEDHQIRTFIGKHPDARIRQKYRNAGIDKIEIDRTRDEVKVTLFVARPGLIIGQKGSEIERLQEELQNLVGRRINLKVEEVGRPELRAQLVANDIADQMAKRSSFRRTMKRALETTMEAGAKGIKVQLAGRLGGAEMARREKQIAGSIPLSTLRAKIDYGFSESKTAQGHIGVQVWINNGYYEGDDSDGQHAEENQAPKKSKKTYKR
ncbi:MAG: 30S ribosomal protein S3 [Pirellulales bacterium]|jgi:small subunit ribosomal protein S3